MTVILRDTVPPIIEISSAIQLFLHSLLYQSAYQDQRYDRRNCIRRNDRRDCGGTTIGLTKPLPILLEWESKK